MSARGFDLLAEWPCEDCDHAGSTAGYFDPFSGAVEPPEPRCTAEACPVDVPALRELEAEIALAAAFVSGACRIATVHTAPAIIDALAEALADGLEELYSERACVGHAAIRAALMTRACREALMLDVPA